MRTRRGWGPTVAVSRVGEAGSLRFRLLGDRFGGGRDGNRIELILLGADSVEGFKMLCTPRSLPGVTLAMEDGEAWCGAMDWWAP